MAHLDSGAISDIIRTATRKIITDTEQFLDSIEGKTLGDKTVSIMINGVEKIINSDDYAKLKAHIKEIKAQMKAQIKAIKEQFKEDLNQDLKK